MEEKKGEKMKKSITIWCTKCGSQIDERDNVYCEPCIDAKDEELQKLDERIKKLEYELSKLKGG